MSYLIMFMLISFLILFHELGHLIAAKLSNIPIELFSVGFGPKLWSFRKGQTEYRISSLPIAGYVLPKMEDLDDYFQIDSSFSRFRNNSVFPTHMIRNNMIAVHQFLD